MKASIRRSVPKRKKQAPAEKRVPVKRAKLPFGRFDDRNGLSLAADAATARDAEKPPAA